MKESCQLEKITLQPVLSKQPDKRPLSTYFTVAYKIL